MSDQSTIQQAWESKNAAPYLKSSRRGLDEDLVREISQSKNEPEWMLERRLQALELYNTIAKPAWGPDLSKLDLASIT